MFIHAVLFQMHPSQIKTYRKDCRMWAKQARKEKGFIRYATVKRCGCKNQYASSYEWKTRVRHERFMKKYHEYLVAKSEARVRVLGYYNLESVDEVK